MQETRLSKTSQQAGIGTPNFKELHSNIQSNRITTTNYALKYPKTIMSSLLCERFRFDNSSKIEGTDLETQHLSELQHTSITTEKKYKSKCTLLANPKTKLNHRC